MHHLCQADKDLMQPKLCLSLDGVLQSLVGRRSSFCSLWLEDKNETMDDVIKKTKEVLPLMNTMERLLEEPGVRLSREIMSRDF